MDPSLSSLLETTVELDEGGCGHVFTIKSISERSDISLWQCHLCDVKGADEESLLLHIKSKEHEEQMALPSHPKRKFMLVEKKIVKTTELTQPAPPGTEEYIEIKPSETTLGIVFDSFKNSALIGLEYIIEVLRPEIGQESYCVCMLCDKKCDRRTIIGHITSFMHRVKYLTIYFPTFATTMQEKLPRNKAGKKQMMDLVGRLVPRIEEKFGRLRPLYVEKEENLEDRKKFIFNKILEDNHLKETESETFLDVLEETSENDSKPESAGLPKFVDVNECVEPEVPETLVRHVSQLEAVLEVSKNNPVVGLDYVVELRDEEDDEHTYFCTLCEKQGDPRVTVCHLISLKHRHKFIGQHFPKTKELLNNKFKDDKRAVTNALKLIAAKVEEKYGRKSPVVVTRDIFESNKHIVIRKIIDSNHFREPLDETFVELILKQMTYLKSHKIDEPEDPDNKMQLDNVEEKSEDEATGSSNKKEKSNKSRRKTESNIEKMLRNNDRPIIGVEYLIELTSRNPNKEPVFMCAYCDKKGDPRVAMNHFTSYKHCAKYINVFFPAAKKTILYLIGTMKECKKGIGEMIMVLCAQIQKKYGWLKPRSYDEDYFERNRKTIIDEIADGEHLRETPEENFVEYVKNTLEEVNSYVDYDEPPVDIPTAPPDDFGGRRQLFHHSFHSVPKMPAPHRTSVPQMPPKMPAPHRTSVPQMPPKMQAPLTPLVPQMPMPTVSAVPIKPLTMNRSNRSPHAMSTTSPPAKRSGWKHWTAKEVPKMPAPHRTSVPQMPVPSTSAKPKTSAISPASPIKLKISPHAVSTAPPPAKRSSSHTQNTLRSEKKAPIDLPSLKPELHGKTKSRSTSPFDIEFGRISPVNESLKSTSRWEIYERKFKKLQEDIIKDLNYYKVNPEEHPLYATEWEKFWNKWYDRIKDKGQDPAKQNIMPEWIAFWNKKVRELFKQKFESMKQDIKRDYGSNVLWKPVIGHRHEEEETHKDTINNRRRERSNSESPPLKRFKHSSRNKELDIRSKEITWEKEISKERTFRRRSRERSRERRYSREETRRSKSREKTHDKESRGKAQYRRESLVDKVRDKKSAERERKSGKESQTFQKSGTSLERSRQKDVDKESNEGKHSIKSSIINTGLVSVLRMATALEDQLGSLGPQVNALLGSALSLEKMAVSSSEALLENSEHFTLLDTVKEKLRGRLTAGIVDRNMVLAAEKCVDLLERVMLEAEKKNAVFARNITLPVSLSAENINSTASAIIGSPLKTGMFSRVPISDRRENSRGGIVENVTTVQQVENLRSVASLLTKGTILRERETVTHPASSTVDRVAIAQEIASLLIKQGKYDVAQDELEQLINYVAMNRLSPGSTPNFYSQMQQQQQQQQNHPGTLLSNPSIIEHLSMDDLSNLLKNFQVLSTEEQQILTEYLRMLQISCPKKIEKLQETLNATLSRILTKSENLSGLLFHSAGQRQQTEILQKNIFTHSENTGNSSDVKYSFVKQFKEREKSSAELQKMKELAIDLRERKNNVLRHITLGLADTRSERESDERIRSTRNHYQDLGVRSQLRSYMWPQQSNRK